MYLKYQLENTLIPNNINTSNINVFQIYEF